MKEELPDIKRYSLFPKTLSKAVEPVLKPLYKKHGFAEHRLLTEWNSIVGSELSTCSIPQKLSSARRDNGGTLHVLVAAPRALEFQHLEPVILDRISTYFGYQAVKKINLIQSSSEIFRKPKTTKTHQKAAPSEKLSQLVSECKDEKLRNALLSLGSLINN